MSNDKIYKHDPKEAGKSYEHIIQILSEQDDGKGLTFMLDSLAREIPEKPFMNNYGTSYCPKCKSLTPLQHLEPYCPFCGQAMDWSDETYKSVKRYRVIDYLGRIKPICKKKRDTLLNSGRGFVTVYETGNIIFISHSKNRFATIVLAILKDMCVFEFNGYRGRYFDYMIKNELNNLSIPVMKRLKKSKEKR